MTLQAFGQHLKEELRQLRHDVISGIYEPRPVRRFYMKKASGKRRPLTIWAVRDRVAQRVIHDYLTPIFEASFLDCSYGFRPGRSPEDAMRAVVEARDTNKRWVLDADIENCFDSIPPSLLMPRVQRAVPSQLARRLIHAWLHAPIEGRRRGIAGVSQGSVISPQLANLYLHSFDEMLLAAMPQATLVRFADDFVILNQRKQQAHWSLTVTRRCLLNLRLHLNQDKTRVIHFDEGFTFLGATFKGNVVSCPVNGRSDKETS